MRLWRGHNAVRSAAVMGAQGSLRVGPVQDDTVPRAVRELAEELLPAAPQLARELTDHLYATMPELAGNEDAGLREETRASTEANLDQVIRLLRAGADVDAVVVPVDAA